ncbi:MAG: hypothetical protein WEB00_03880 [Dehalococcoidia bacterium]
MNKTRRFPAALGLTLIALLVVATAVGAGFMASRGGAGDVATQAHGTEATSEEKAPHATPTAASSVVEESAPDGEAGHELIYAEFGRSADRIMAFDPESGDERELASVPHAESWGITGGVSSRGDVAFLALPELNIANMDLAAASSAELWAIVDGELSPLASGFDLRSPPEWSPDGSAVAVQTINYSPDFSAAAASITLVELDGSTRTLVERDSLLTIEVVGFSADGDSLYFAEKAVGGSTLIKRVSTSGGEASTITEGDDFIEYVSWTVSGEQLAAVVLDGSGDLGRKVVIVGLNDGRRSDALSGATLSPAWRGEELSVGLAGGDGRGVVVSGTDAERELAAASGGFDAPRFWSRDGALLALLHFGEFPPQRSGTPIVLLEDGERLSVPASEVTLFGWR